MKNDDEIFSETERMTTEEWMAYQDLSRFEKSLISHPLPKSSWEKYARGSKCGEDYCIERTLEEIVEYKRSRVSHPIFRWFTDGKYKLQKIVEDKKISISKYQVKVDKTDPFMVAKIVNKKSRLKHYQDKIDKIEEVMSDYTKYTYEELEDLPSRIFDEK